jgi:hypothetical protein
MAGLEESVMNMVDIYDDLTDAEMEVWMEFVCSEVFRSLPRLLTLTNSSLTHSYSGI